MCVYVHACMPHPRRAQDQRTYSIRDSNCIDYEVLLRVGFVWELDPGLENSPLQLSRKGALFSVGKAWLP